ncbi:MAG TPA: hypothetical protein PLQ00_04180 [Thermoguttaceae bacterium]|nr:hypothetical protein [Thermoguttaceae bacterium]
MIPKETLQAESPTKRADRRRKVDELLAQRQRAFQAVASMGLPPSTPPSPGGHEQSSLSKSKPPIYSKLSPENKPLVSAEKTAREVEFSICKTESAIVHERIEYGILLDENGIVLWKQQGTESSVRFTPKQLAMMPGRVLTHNHVPAYGTHPTFSKADVKLMIERQLKQIRAVTPKYRFLMSPTRPLPQSEQARKQLATEVTAAFQTYFYQLMEPKRNHLEKQVKRGKMTFEEYKRRYIEIAVETAHLAWSHTAEQYGFFYKREKR